MKGKSFLVLAILTAMFLFITACSQPGEDDVDTPGEEQIEQGQQDQENESDDAEENDDEEKFAQMVKDNAPEGCASCHKKTDDKDYRLSAEVEKIEGHPEVKEDADVNDCMICHSGEERAFRTILHRVHLVEGEHYTDKYDHNCINCHEVSDEGEITVKGIEQAE